MVEKTLDFSLHEDVLARLKTADPDRVRAAMFADEASRERLLLLYAFHLELAKVPELVSEPMIGQIRYQWWREAIAEIYEAENVRKHEITTPLRALLLEYDIPRFWVDQLIDGRERDIDPRPFESLTEAQDYCAATSGALMKIAVKLSGEETQEGVEAAGIAWGMTGLARAYGYYHETMLSAVSFERLCQVARAKHKEAASALSKLNNEAFPAIAYASLVPPYIKRLTKKGFNPKSEQVTYTAFGKQTRLLGAVLRGRV